MNPRGNSTRKWLVLLATACLLPLVLGGCALIMKVVGLFGGDDRTFSHRQHMDVEMGFFLECSDCHQPVMAGEKYEIGGHAVCRECHEDEVDGPPAPKCKRCHDQEAPPPAEIRDYLGSERIFSHADHEDVGCNGCHMETGLGGRAMTISSMPDCIACHETSSATIECEGCHREIRKDLEPASHDDFFISNHGRVAGLTRGYCDFCHTEDECAACHATMKPRSHTLRWKDMAHGIYAVRERRSCAVCHSAESCDECHSIRPQTHMRPGWDAGPGHREQARLNTRSCFACHDFTETCEACHAGRRDIDFLRR